MKTTPLARFTSVGSALALLASALVVLTSPQVAANTYAAPAAPKAVRATATPNGITVRFQTVTAQPAVTHYIVTGGAGTCPITVPATTRGSVTLPLTSSGIAVTPQVQAVNAYGISAPAKFKAFTAAELAGVKVATSLKSVQILQLSDFHGAIEGSSSNAGAALLASAFEADRKKVASTITLSAGDNIGAAPPISAAFEELSTIEAMNLMKFDVSGFGNHEHDRDIAHVQKVIAASDFQWVASNYSSLEPLKSGSKSAKAFTLIDRGDITIGVVAANTEQTKEQIFPGNLSYKDSAGATKELEISASAAGVNQAIKDARAAGAQMIVALLHQGWQENTGGKAVGRLVDLSAEIKGADVVFGGHSHLAYSSISANGALVGQTINAGQQYNRVQVCINTTSNRMRGASLELVPRSAFATLTPNADAAALVKKYKDQLSSKLDVKIGQVNGIFAQGGSPQVQRAGEAAIGNFTADALRSKYGTDFAYINGGGIRDKFPASSYTPADKSFNRPGTDKVAPYDVTLGDAIAVYPFGNTVGVTEVTGANLWKALENGVSNWPGDGRFPQISGFKFTFDTSKPVGSRVQEVIKSDGTAIAKDDKVYTIAVPDFMIYGGDGYVGVFSPSKAKLRDLLVDVFVEAVKAGVASGKPLEIPALDGRIKKLN